MTAPLLGPGKRAHVSRLTLDPTKRVFPRSGGVQGSQARWDPVKEGFLRPFPEAMKVLAGLSIENQKALDKQRTRLCQRRKEHICCESGIGVVESELGEQTILCNLWLNRSSEGHVLAQERLGLFYGPFVLGQQNCARILAEVTRRDGSKTNFVVLALMLKGTEERHLHPR